MFKPSILLFNRGETFTIYNKLNIFYVFIIVYLKDIF